MYITVCTSVTAHHLGGLGACPPRKFLAFRSPEIDSGTIWVVKIAIIFISFSMTRSCSLQKLLVDLGVNVILVTTLAKHCSYMPMLYNLDYYCFKTLNSPRGGGALPKNFNPEQVTIMKFTGKKQPFI